MGFLEDRDLSDVPTIPAFYAGKTIFITGGSGFIGKVIIEKLLYSCSDLDRIYLLLRTKRGLNPEERLMDLYSTACFDRLRTERPGLFESKVYVIPGDVMEPGLGISEEDRTLLINRTNIIFHVAASVRFDDPLKFAVKLNLLGTKQIVELAKSAVNLCALVHVSTSYSNTNRDLIEEVMYPPHADWRDTLEVCEKLDEHTLRLLTKKYLGELPNTYTFSKQLAEHVVYEQKGQLPAVIVRPSIVISSIKEPMPGWVENFNGPVGIFVACGKGIMRTIHTKPDIVSDYIPVDTCVKNIIATAWIRGTKKLESKDDIQIYNCCAGNLNSIDVEGLMNMAKTVASTVPINGMLWNIGGSVTTSETIYYIRVLLQHLLPAVMVDTILWLLGKKPMLIKVQRRIYIANSALRYYITNQWTFDNQNFTALRSVICNEDKDGFYYDVENVDVLEYFINSCRGGKKYLLKESEEDCEKAKVHYKRMYLLDKTTQVAFYGLLSWWSMNIAFDYFKQCYGEVYVF